MDVIREHGLRWRKLSEERSAGYAIGLLMRGSQSVYGWIASRQGDVWSAFTAPKIGPNVRVNPLRDGHLVGIYYSAPAAMEAVEAKCGHMIEQAIENRRAAMADAQRKLQDGLSGQR